MHAVTRTGKVLLATLNEKATISAVLEEIAESIHLLARLGWNLSVTILDDGDDPEFRSLVGVCSQLFGIDVEVVEGKRRGLGAAIIQGFEHCLQNKEIEFVVNLDADGQHDGRQIGELLRMISSTDAGITIGSRWTRGGRCSGLTRSRRILSRCSSIALRSVGVPWEVKDPTTSFRVYDRQTVEILSRELIGFNGFSFFGAAIVTATAYGISVNESPIHFRPRMSGESNLSLNQTLKAIRDLPRIGAHSKMIKLREREFNPSSASPQNYSAHRELELLSSTPVSTRIIVNTLSPHIGSNVLEVGSGLGLITQMLVDDGKKVTALEPDANLFDQFSKNISSTNVRGYCLTLGEYLERCPSKNSFDTILYVNVLEHIRDDIGELKTALDAMQENAKIVIFVPASPRLYGTMDWISGHFRRYRMNELKSVAEIAGLRLVECRAFDPIGVLPYWFMYRVLKRRTLSVSSVSLYDKVVIPLSAAIPSAVIRRTGGKNLILVGQLQSST
jgi:protein-L-isoaspartate O-methyltransferase